MCNDNVVESIWKKKIKLNRTTIYNTTENNKKEKQIWKINRLFSCSVEQFLWGKIVLLCKMRCVYSYVTWFDVQCTVQ